MQLFNIICNTYAVRVADGETKFRLETTTATGCNSLSEVKQEMRNRYENYTNPVAWGKKWNLVSSRTFCRDSYSQLVFDLPVPEGVIGERREFYITKAII